MNQNQCPFCEPAERIIKDNELAYVVLSNPRKMKGHVLVNPKRHVEHVGGLRKDEILAIFELIDYVQQKLIGVLGDGCDVRQHFMPYLKQSKLKVDHVHFHVMPRSFDDSFYRVAGRYEDELFEDLNPAEAEAVAKLLR